MQISEQKYSQLLPGLAIKYLLFVLFVALLSIQFVSDIFILSAYFLKSFPYF